MWALLAEWAANVLAGTARPYRLSRTVVAVLALALFTAFLMARWGLVGTLPALLLLGVLLAAAREVFVARDRLWNAASLPLDDARQKPTWADRAGPLAPTAVALNRLALAIDAARRGQYAEANELAHLADRPLLRRDEIAVLDAVRAMVCLGLGDTGRAAQLAVLAVPTGVPDMDLPLGRAMVADAWRDSHRLSAIDGAWSAAGVRVGTDEALAKLRSLVRLRLEPAVADHVSPAQAAALSDEARAIGDDELAAELSAQARRSGTYR